MGAVFLIWKVCARYVIFISMKPTPKFPKHLQDLIDRYASIKAKADKAKSNAEENRKVADKPEKSDA